MTAAIAQAIRDGRAVLGIELGSTRIKACLVLADDPTTVLAVGSHAWENRFVDRRWTYGLDDVWSGLQAAYADLGADVARRYDATLESVAAIGVSAMMHGYLAFGEDGALLTGFRTWRNTNTDRSAAVLSELFGVNIPLRWSIAHLYQAVLDEEPHVTEVAFFTTLAGYVHWKLTGRKVLGVGDASGMFPIDSATRDYDAALLEKFDRLVGERAYGMRVSRLLPEVLVAGEPAGELTAEGAALLDPSGALRPGAQLCPPEGDAGTGMVATCSVAPRTGNVSAGTSIFAMVVLERPLSRVHHELDLVTTPAGDPVAMVHCNNGASELAAWVGLFDRFATVTGGGLGSDEVFEALFREALDGDPDAAASSRTTISRASPSPGSPRAARCSCARPTAASRSPTSCGRSCTACSARSPWACACSRARAWPWTACSPTAGSSAPRGSRSASSPVRWAHPWPSGRRRRKGERGASRCSARTCRPRATSTSTRTSASACSARHPSTPSIPTPRTSPGSPPTSAATAPGSPSNPPRSPHSESLPGNPEGPPS